MFGRDPEPKGLAHYVSKLRSGASSLPRISLDILYGARNEDRTLLDNRAKVARDFVTRLERHGRGYADAGLLLCHAQVDAADLGEICDAGERIIAAKPTVINYRMSGLNVGPHVCPERDYRTGKIKHQSPNDGNEVDVVLPIIYPYGDGVSIGNAVSVLNTNFHKVKEAAAGFNKKVWISGYGWPSAGESVGQAVASPDNSSRYLREFVSWAQSNDLDYFYMEAVDEPWRATFTPHFAHWGIWDKYGAMKSGIANVFSK